MIGLFGGTFDPIHFGHLRPALEVLETLALHEVRFIPAHIPPHRGTPRIDAAARASMVATAIQDAPGFVLDTLELERDTPSYTVETLVRLRARYGEKRPLVLMMGSDAFNGLPGWYQWTKLLELAHIAVMARPGEPAQPQRFPKGFLEHHTTTCREDLRLAPAGSILRVPVTQLDISATYIRQCLATGASVRYLMPTSLIDYIYAKRYYISSHA